MKTQTGREVNREGKRRNLQQRERKRQGERERKRGRGREREEPAAEEERGSF